MTIDKTVHFSYNAPLNTDKGGPMDTDLFYTHVIKPQWPAVSYEQYALIMGECMKVYRREAKVPTLAGTTMLLDKLLIRAYGPPVRKP